MDRDEDDISDMSDAEAMRRVERSGRDGEFVENHAADNGIIEEVQCRNFMCHANLTVKLGPLINFIIGHNGSGKSAVLTALQLCLGGKATSTNRGQSLKHFIKAGTDQATLSVKIKNQGDNAYQPDIYGKSIVVERIFSRAGTSGFKLKNEHGKIISSKKSDLEDILDALALQMDNPMNVLTQDMARQFLNSSNAIEKYKFFYKGTHLEQLDSDYRILQESLELNQQQYYNLEASAKDAGARYKETERKAALAERAAGLQDQYLHYSKQMAWVQVEDEEKKLAGMEDDIRKQEEVIQERVSAAEEFDVHMQSIDRQRDDAKSALDAIIAEKGSKAEEHEKAKENFEQVRTQLMELQTTQRGIKEEMVTAQKNIDRWNGEIEKERERISSADNGRHAQKMEEIQTAEDSLTSTREEAQQKSSGSHVFDRAVTEAQSEVEEAKSALDNNTTSIRSAENRIRTFQREKGDWKAAYSPRLGTLLKAIEQESRFREKPVGPLGRHVALLKPSWSDILEKQAGSALNAFAVTSKGDQTLLSQLMRRTNYDGQIYVTSSRPINTTQHEPPQQYDTWMRVLKFDNDLVRNCMIINQGVDKTVLEPDSEKGARMLNQNIPNMSQIFSPNPVPDGAGNKWGYRFGLSNGGGESQTPIHPWNGGSRMQTDTGTQIK
jgi:chromosome segregation ATPase